VKNTVHIISVSGLPGSGTSTVCQRLSERLGWHYVDAGQIFRQLAAEAGASLAEFGRRAEADGHIDRELDARMVEMARQREGIILEGRLTGWMTYRHDLSALKVWLKASTETRAARVGKRDGQSLEQTLQEMVERQNSEHQRYAEHHGIEIGDLSIYDLIIDTEAVPPAQVAAQIIAALGDGPAG
jgi:cytidylate kinase